MLVVEAPADSEPASPDKKREEAKNSESSPLSLEDNSASRLRMSGITQPDETIEAQKTNKIAHHVHMDASEEDEAIAAWQGT